ncbi:hypothetical protein PMAYCL1PPCAC_16706 [Pristionchus mayeri]|uniref:SHSP domain-containing protein n=1 Tax=Pristionchus mayeri TaxID=1317129 RepID=A0AAN5CLC5_9BILA|nr:hypothetical protein PMAYCL1PPCAC_16706 [Pristionchus mayeri]
MPLRRNRPCFDLALIHAFGEMFAEEQHGSYTPYWGGMSSEIENSLGGAIGGVENNKEKFAVKFDVSYFEPEEIKVRRTKVNVNGNDLTIEGDHEEKSVEYGSIKRSFVRTCRLPEDTNRDSLCSSLSDRGRLSVEAPKKTSNETQSRAIPVFRL